MTTAKMISRRRFSAAMIILPLAIALAAGPGITPAAAEEKGGEKSGGGQKGDEGKKGGSENKGPHRNGKGPDPNCPYQDHSGRGRQSAGPNTRGALSEQAADQGSPEGASATGSVSGGGGGGGENFICDGAGDWHVNTKIFNRTR